MILGGAAFEDDIALEGMTRNPEVDLIHCGDAYLILARARLQAVRRTHPEGPARRHVARRGRHPVRGAGRAPNFADLDRSPDFDEYFAPDANMTGAR